QSGGMMSSTRREFMTRSATMLAWSHLIHWSIRRPMDVDTTVLLFQGDSITDGGRDRTVTAANDLPALGSGYPRRVAEMLRTSQPFLQINVFNRGVSGNVVADLSARWQGDTLDLKPTILSILIGVNDVWHTLGKSPAAEVVATYETGYRALLDRTRTALPNIRLVVLEP